MALRIYRSVVNGEIDNRTRGQVRGSLWIVGRSEPISLNLRGNCLRDLAGCSFRFRNPNPQSAEEERVDALAGEQNGITGDITASRKVRLVDPIVRKKAVEEEPAPERLANCLYIEWFSDRNGRVVLETTDYVVEASEPVWTMSPEEEAEQIASTHEAMRDWLEQLQQALEQEQDREESPSFDPEEDKPMDEFGYERLMRESDARTDKYLELLEKYKDRPDQEKIVAKEMGWEWLEEALEANERGALPQEEKMEVPDLVPNPATEGIDWIRVEDGGIGGIRHPLSHRAFESSIEMWQFCEDQKLLGDDCDPDLFEMVSQFQTAGAKLAGALNSLAYDDDEHSRDGGFVVAALKRSLKYLHASIDASEKVATKNLLGDEQLRSFRDELFAIREEILALMQRYRGKAA